MKKLFFLEKSTLTLIIIFATSGLLFLSNLLFFSLISPSELSDLVIIILLLGVVGILFSGMQNATLISLNNRNKKLEKSIRKKMRFKTYLITIFIIMFATNFIYLNLTGTLSWVLINFILIFFISSLNPVLSGILQYRRHITLIALYSFFSVFIRVSIQTFLSFYNYQLTASEVMFIISSANLITMIAFIRYFKIYDFTGIRFDNSVVAYGTIIIIIFTIFGNIDIYIYKLIETQAFNNFYSLHSFIAKTLIVAGFYNSMHIIQRIRELNKKNRIYEIKNSVRSILKIQTIIGLIIIFVISPFYNSIVQTPNAIDPKKLIWFILANSIFSLIYLILQVAIYIKIPGIGLKLLIVTIVAVSLIATLDDWKITQVVMLVLSFTLYKSISKDVMKKLSDIK